MGRMRRDDGTNFMTGPLRVIQWATMGFGPWRDDQIPITKVEIMIKC